MQSTKVVYLRFNSQWFNFFSVLHEPFLKMGILLVVQFTSVLHLKNIESNFLRAVLVHKYGIRHALIQPVMSNTLLVCHVHYSILSTALNRTSQTAEKSSETAQGLCSRGDIID